MNLSDIKNLISEVGKVVFVENDKVVGVFLSYDEYRKMVAQKGEQCPASSLPLFTSKEKPVEPKVSGSPAVLDETFDDELVDIVAEEPEEPEVVVVSPISEAEKPKPNIPSLETEKELTIDDLPF